MFGVVGMDGSKFHHCFGLINHSFMQSYGVKCLQMLALCFVILTELLHVTSIILSFCLGTIQSSNPTNTSINNIQHSTIHSTNRRSTQSIKSIQDRKKIERRKKKQWDTTGYSHWYLMNEWSLMLVLFGYSANNNNQQNCITRRRWCIAVDAKASCTMTHVFVVVHPLAHNAHTKTEG